MKKVLVTGGAGFIGSNLTRELVKQGYMVDIVDDMSNGHLELLDGLKLRHLPNSFFLQHYNNQTPDRPQEEVVFVEDSFASLGMLQHIYEKNYDFIFHQAAIPRVSYSVENPGETTDTNVSDTVRLFEASIDNVERIVFASSSSVYGGSEDLPIHESKKKDPLSPYAWQKSCIEDYAELCYALYKLDIVCLRYFNVFGPGQHGDSPYSTAVSAWCHAIKNGKMLRSDGTGEQSRDLCYVDNVVAANILAAERSGLLRGRCYNIACGDRITNREILDYLNTNYDITVRDTPWRQGDVMHTQANIDRAIEELCYRPKVKFWDGFEKTLNWWGINSK